MAGELAFYTMAALFVLMVVWGRNKQRQKPESKTPYDYALTNAISERDRLQDELRTIQALKRTEADTERIRSEIDTILSDDGEGETESVYGGLNAIPIVQHSDGTISKAFAKACGTNVREDGAEDEQLSEDDVERSLINDIKEKTSENLELAVEFAKMTVQDDEAIRKRLEETSKELSKEIGELRRRMREFRRDGKYYGETLYRKGNR